MYHPYQKVAANAFALFENPNKSINFKDFVAIFALYHSTIKDIIEFIFLLFDVRQDKYITRDESILLAQSYIAITKQDEKTNKERKDTIDQIVNQLHQKSEKIDLATFASEIGTAIDIFKIIEPFEIIPRAYKEKEIIKSILAKSTLESCDCQYVISTKWWRQWEIYVSYSNQTKEQTEYYESKKNAKIEDAKSNHLSEEEVETQRISLNIAQSKPNDLGSSLSLGYRPGPIDCSDLLDQVGNEKLKADLVYKKDYVLVPDEAWENLIKWYGVITAAIRCSVVMKAGKPSVDLYPPKMYISVCINDQQ